MGFRGVLLAVGEGEKDKYFHVVSPDAMLQLPVNGLPRDAPHIASQKLVVTDAITTELLQVARLSGALLQRTTRSVLWAATVVSKADAEELPVPIAGSTFAFDPHSPVKRVCYCFHFRADIDFETFERAQQAAQRVQHQSLLETSVLMELEIQRLKLVEPEQLVPVLVPEPTGHKELKRRREELRRQLKATEDEEKQAEKIRRQADEMAVLREKAKAAEAAKVKVKVEAGRAPKATSPSGPKPAPTPAAVVDEIPSVQCILCGTDDTCRSVAGTFVKHPYVLKDGKGNPVMVCKICLQRVLKRRISWEQKQGNAQHTREVLCGMCADPTNTTSGETKACIHPICHRVYCEPCLKTLFGKAQVKKVWRTKHWLCPNCAPADSATTASVVAAVVGDNAQPEPAPKKRKRSTEPSIKVEPSAIQIEDPTEFVVDVDKVVVTDADGKEMTVLDYVLSYAEFLVEREAHLPPPKESEDSCFCCKDGGDLMECDFRHGKLRCHKVYHSDCLGFDVPDDEKWLCPRHRCYKCGFAAQFACRFCVTSFCKGHMKENLEVIGPATPEIHSMSYVVCGSCDYVLKKGVEKGKITQELYDRALHPVKPTKRKKQRAA